MPQLGLAQEVIGLYPLQNGAITVGEDDTLPSGREARVQI